MQDNVYIFLVYNLNEGSQCELENSFHAYLKYEGHNQVYWNIARAVDC